MTKYYLAIDIGASSGRHMLGHVENGRMVLEEVHRFDNRQVHKNGHDCWDMEHLWKGVLEGIRKCGQLGQAEGMLMIPDYLNYLLTGVKRQEYTNATSTGLVHAQECRWDYELIRRLGLPERLFGELSMPETRVGELLPGIAEKVGFSSAVILPATHDTGSAFLAVPAQEDTSVYLSSGTWSLLGVENEAPVTTEESRRQNFTNEGGAWYRYRFLKNIMGLWMIQSVRRELNGESYVAGRESRHASGRKWGFAELSGEAEKERGFASVVDVNDPCFLNPESMIDAIKEYCKKSGQAVPESIGEIMQCIYVSLAGSYKKAIEELSALTGKKYTCLHIVGGGCQDQYLNRMTATACGLPVYAGPVEGTAIGNLVVQMVAAGEFESLQEARAAIRKSFDIKEVC